MGVTSENTTLFDKARSYKVVLIVAGNDTPVSEQFGHGEALLIGRDPNIKELGVPLPVPSERVRVIVLDSNLVSRNHILVWSTDGVVHCLDLKSTNGTRLVVRDVEVSAKPKGEESITFELAPEPSPPRLRVGQPGRLHCDTAEEFARCAKAELDNWFKQNGLGCSVSILDEGSIRNIEHTNQTIMVPGQRALRIEGPFPVHGHTDQLPDVLEIVRGWILDERARLADDIARREHHDHGDDFVMASPAMQETHRVILQAARAHVSVVLVGESGVGKSRLARCYHAELRVKGESKFQQINCGIYEDRKFLQATLFGAKSGAWTDLHEDRIGVVELANQGTLFLDQVNDLSLELQSILLTFLDTGRYLRMGDPTLRKSEVNIICATNQDLREAVRQGRFREDLWWRLANVVVEVPPLRRRWEDVVARLSRVHWPPIPREDQFRAQKAPSPDRSIYAALNTDARVRLQEYPWPGNLRELQSFIRRLPFQAQDAREIDWRTCSLVLASGSLLPDSFSSSPTSSMPPTIDIQTTVASPVVSTSGNVLDVALKVFEEFRKEQRGAELKDFMERVFKPLYVADRLGLKGFISHPVRGRSYARMAREVGLKDGESVRELLERYNLLKQKYGELIP